MVTQWYVKTETGESGPFSSSQLKQLASSGHITLDSFVRRQSDERWSVASNVKGLFPVTASSVLRPHCEPPEIPRGRKVALGTVLGERSEKAGSGTAPLYLWCFVSIAGTFLVCLLCYAVFFRSGKNETAVTPQRLMTASGNHNPSNGREQEEMHAGGTQAEDTVARVEPSIALLRGRLSCGSRFLVIPGILVTNKHVISSELPRHVKAHFPSAPLAKRGPFDVELTCIDARNDLAILSVNVDLPPLDLASTYSFRRGQEVLVIGSPGVSGELVLENAISRGVMSTKVTIGELDYYQLGIAINPGNSGGPVLDLDGHVIGVVTLKAPDKEGLGFSIPIEDVHSALRAVSATTAGDLETLRSRHRARVVFKYVNLTGVLYKAGMEYYTAAMSEAIDRGLSADSGLDLVRNDVEKKLSLVDEAFVGDLKKEMVIISTDPVIPESTRQRFVDFWTNYLEIKSYVENPRGSYDSYRKKFHELADVHDRMSASLALLLGVNPED